MTRETAGCAGEHRESGTEESLSPGSLEESKGFPSELIGEQRFGAKATSDQDCVFEVKLTLGHDASLSCLNRWGTAWTLRNVLEPRQRRKKGEKEEEREREEREMGIQGLEILGICRRSGKVLRWNDHDKSLLEFSGVSGKPSFWGDEE